MLVLSLVLVRRRCTSCCWVLGKCAPVGLLTLAREWTGMGWWSVARWTLWGLVVPRIRSRLIKVILARRRSLLIRLLHLLRLEVLLLGLEVLVLVIVVVELASLELLLPIETSCTATTRNQVVRDHDVSGQSGDLIVQESNVLAGSSLVVVVLVTVLKGVQHGMGHSRLFRSNETFNPR